MGWGVSAMLSHSSEREPKWGRRRGGVGVWGRGDCGLHRLGNWGQAHRETPGSSALSAFLFTSEQRGERGLREDGAELATWPWASLFGEKQLSGNLAELKLVPP